MKYTPYTFQNWEGACVEIDIRKCFNTIPHETVKYFLKQKITDKAMIQLIINLMKTQVCVGEETIKSDLGCQQGSIVSPILANIFLHHVIDEWFDNLKLNHFKGYAAEVRYADDMVFVFGNRHEAEKFYKVLPKRLQKYGLELSVEKSQILPSGHLAAAKAHREGKRLPTFKFLGFTCYWGKTRNGFWRLKYTSRKDRFTEKLKGLRKYLGNNLNTKNTKTLLISAIKVIRGWVNYHAISDNQRRVNGFIEKSKRIIRRWFKRRGGRHVPKWEHFNLRLKSLGFPYKWKTISMFSSSPK